MESRMYDGRNSKRVKVSRRSPKDKDEDVVLEDKKVEEEPEIKSKREYKPKTVRLVLQKRKKVKTKGSVSGKEYFFDGAGSDVEVDERDVPELLAKGAGRKNCCGGAQPTPYFQIVE